MRSSLTHRHHHRCRHPQAHPRRRGNYRARCPGGGTDDQGRPARLPPTRNLGRGARNLRAFGIEGTGSYGAGLARALRDGGYTVHEVSRPDRRLRRQHGKTDHLDAEGAARAVLGGQATGLPKASTGRVEMIRHLKVARDTAVKARTQAMLTLKAVIIAAPAALREKLEAIAGTMALVRHLAALRPGAMTSPTASAKASLRALARRWLDLDAEIKAHDAHLEALVEHRARRW